MKCKHVNMLLAILKEMDWIFKIIVVLLEKSLP